jgi:hypothetical protein
MEEPVIAMVVARYADRQEFDRRFRANYGSVYMLVFLVPLLIAASAAGTATLTGFLISSIVLASTATGAVLFVRKRALDEARFMARIADGAKTSQQMEWTYDGQAIRGYLTDGRARQNVVVLRASLSDKERGKVLPKDFPTATVVRK